MAFANLCNNTATFKRKTTTDGPGGGQVDSWAPVYTDVACTIQPAQGSVIERFQRRSMAISHVLYTPTTLVLKTDDVAEAADGRTFQVKSFGDMAGRGVATAVYLIEAS